MSAYEIFALKYAGPREGPAALVLWNREWDQTFKRSSFIWCIKGPAGPIVVDAGVEPAMAEKMGLPGYVPPPQLLAGLGVEAAQVKHLILTHLHWDHVNGLKYFPQATVYLQESEYEFWSKHPLSRRPVFQLPFDQSAVRHLEVLKQNKKLVLLKGDTEIMPGIECLLAPGHTVGLQAVAVSTKKGTAVLGSDCGHTFRNYREDWPSVFITDLKAWLESFDKLRAKVSSLELLFPGHDPLMTDNYPVVAENVTRLV